MKKINRIKFYLDIISTTPTFRGHSVSNALAREVGVSPQVANMWVRNAVQSPRDETLGKVVKFINKNLPDNQARIKAIDLIGLE